MFSLVCVLGLCSGEWTEKSYRRIIRKRFCTRLINVLYIFYFYTVHLSLRIFCNIWNTLFSNYKISPCASEVRRWTCTTYLLSNDGIVPMHILYLGKTSTYFIYPCLITLHLANFCTSLRCVVLGRLNEMLVRERPNFSRKVKAWSSGVKNGRLCFHRKFLLEGEELASNIRIRSRHKVASILVFRSLRQLKLRVRRRRKFTCCRDVGRLHVTALYVN